jgi:hypothetical protein
MDLEQCKALSSWTRHWADMGYCYCHEVHAVKTTQNVMTDSDFLYAWNVSTSMQTTKPWSCIYQLHFVSRKGHCLIIVHPLMDKYSIHEFSAVLFGALKHAIQLPLLNCKREAHATSNKPYNWHCAICFQQWIPLTAWIHTHTHSHSHNNLAENDRRTARCIAIYGACRWKPHLYHCFPNCKYFSSYYGLIWSIVDTRNLPPPKARQGTQRIYSRISNIVTVCVDTSAEFGIITGAWYFLKSYGHCIV